MQYRVRNKLKIEILILELFGSTLECEGENNKLFIHSVDVARYPVGWNA